MKYEAGPSNNFLRFKRVFPLWGSEFPYSDPGEAPSLPTFWRAACGPKPSPLAQAAIFFYLSTLSWRELPPEDHPLERRAKSWFPPGGMAPFRAAEWELTRLYRGFFVLRCVYEPNFMDDFAARPVSFAMLILTSAAKQ